MDIECLEAPLTCKHCKIADIRRKDMVTHENSECDEIVRACEFKAIGCEKVNMTSLYAQTER